MLRDVGTATDFLSIIFPLFIVGGFMLVVFLCVIMMKFIFVMAQAALQVTSKDDKITIRYPVVIKPRYNPNDNRGDVNADGPFFDDVVGVDLTYRGVGAAQDRAKEHTVGDVLQTGRKTG